MTRHRIISVARLASAPPPYVQVLPCPYCGANGTHHDVFRHVDVELGRAAEGEQATSGA